MNIIRTKVAELSAIPAIAYKIKLSSGGSGVKLHRTDRSETAFAVIDKRTGEFLPDKRTDSAIFPDSAFEEALSELAGLPYSSRGKVLIAVSNESDSNEITAPELEETADEAKLDGISQAARVFFSDEFAAITERFADENGKLNYQLMNKQFIQFASGSKVVSENVREKGFRRRNTAFYRKKPRGLPGRQARKHQRRRRESADRNDRRNRPAKRL